MAQFLKVSCGGKGGGQSFGLAGVGTLTGGHEGCAVRVVDLQGVIDVCKYMYAILLCLQQ